MCGRACAADHRPGRLRRPRAARHGRKGQSIRRADRLAAGQCQGIQGVCAASTMPSPDLRSGMTASVTIRCAEVPNAIAGAGAGDVRAWRQVLLLCLRRRVSGKPARVKPGPTNDKFFVIESGLNEGDRVAMNPRAYLAECESAEACRRKKCSARCRSAIGRQRLEDAKPMPEGGGAAGQRRAPPVPAATGPAAGPAAVARQASQADRRRAAARRRTLRAAGHRRLSTPTPAGAAQ